MDDTMHDLLTRFFFPLEFRHKTQSPNRAEENMVLQIG